MMTVAQVLESKGRVVWSIAPDATVFEAIALMAEKGIGALAVVEHDRLVGIISERDYTRKVALEDRSSRGTLVADIMSRNVVTVEPRESIDMCMRLMAEHQFRHLPVLEHGDICGMVSMKDVLRSVISDRDVLIHQLEMYIAGAA